MDKETVGRLTQDWRRLAGNSQAAGREYDCLRMALAELMPEEAEAAAVIPIEGKPTVVVVSGASLLLVSTPLDEDAPSDAPNPVASVRRLPLAADRVTVSVADDYHRNPRGAVSEHARSWTFSWPYDEKIEFESVVELRNSLDHHDPYPEQVARAMTAALGWAIPTSARDN